jgi:hypothetical protein
MPSDWRRPALSAGLLLVLLIVVAGGLGLLGGLVLLPQLGAVGWVAVGALLFLGLQLVLFRALGLRSKADEEPGAASPEDQPPAAASEQDPHEGDADWRAWRG